MLYSVPSFLLSRFLAFSTHFFAEGIDISELNIGDVDFSAWDFGGQEVFYFLYFLFPFFFFFLFCFFLFCFLFYFLIFFFFLQCLGLLSHPYLLLDKESGLFSPV